MADRPRPRPAALTATELVAAYAAGDLSPVDVLRDVSSVIAARERDLNAFWHLDLAGAQDAAAASEKRWRRGRPLGPVDGVPVTVKENLSRAGVPMVFGTAGTEPVVPARSCPAVERIEDSGGIILGSTVMPDWGMLSSGVSSRHGTTRSPWDRSLTSGGSSSGAGAAAAAGFGPLHLGTDIGGSIRLPGTWLGLTTLKPSAGRVPLDTPYLGRVAGPMTRSAADAALLLSVIEGPDPRDWTSLPTQALALGRLETDVSGLRVGLHLDAGCGMGLDPEVRRAVEAAAETFAAAGAEVVEVEPFLEPSMLRALDEFWRVRSLGDLDALPPGRQLLVLPFIRRWVLAARDLTAAQLMADYAAITAMQRATMAATAAFDLVLSPVAPVAAFPAEWPMPFGDRDEGMAHICFTAPYNMSGQPAGTTNCGFTSDGRTIGLQVSGRSFDDVGLLRALHWFEQHRADELTPHWPIPESGSGGRRARTS